MSRGCCRCAMRIGTYRHCDLALTAGSLAVAQAESLMGEALKKLDWKREDYVLGTKVGVGRGWTERRGCRRSSALCAGPPRVCAATAYCETWQPTIMHCTGANSTSACKTFPEHPPTGLLWVPASGHDYQCQGPLPQAHCRGRPGCGAALCSG